MPSLQNEQGSENHGGNETNRGNPMSSFHIQTLGSLTIKRDDQIIEDFLTLKSSLLITYLAMNPGAHTRDRLATLFWSETTDSQALKNLRTILSDLRKRVPEAITISRQTVQVTAIISVDAVEFESGCDTTMINTERSLDEMLALADLYAGEFLCDTHIRKAAELEEWISFKRDTLNQKYMQLLFQIVDRCIEQGDLYRGVEFARHLVMLNPLWEAAQCQLMTLLAQMGQGGEAQIQYERLVSLLNDELSTTPDPATVALNQQIKAGILKTHDTRQFPKIILPDMLYIPPAVAQTTLRDMLDKPDCRLVTLVGIGGSGKTMLATFTTHERQAQYTDGVALVPLQTVTEENEIIQAILNALNISLKGNPSIDQLIKELQDRKMLIVLDNYEHLLPHTAVVQHILDQTRGIQLLITSQAALNLRQEWLLPLTGLSVDDSADNEAVQLFQQTAQRVVPNFRLDRYKSDIAAICRFLEGLPLGIVIAAGQLKYLSPPAILSLLRDDILAVEALYKDMPERHRGFARLVSSMLANLTNEEQQGLMALSIFRGSFDHEAAIAIAQIPTSTFINLVDRSLIQRIENFRYTLHGLLKHVFAEQLALSSAKESIRKRYTAYYQQWCHNLYHEQPYIHDEVLRMATEYANIWHINLLTPVEQERYILEITPILQSYWRNLGFGDEVVEILDRAIQNEEHPIDMRIRAMVELAGMLVYREQPDRTQSICDTVLSMPQADLYARVHVLQTLARLALQRKDYDTAWNLLEEVFELESEWDRSENPHLDFLFIGNHTGMGLLASNREDLDTARRHYHIALEGWGRYDDPAQQGALRGNLGIIDLRVGSYENARVQFEAAVAATRITGREAMLMSVLAYQARAHNYLGDYPKALESVDEALRISIRIKRKPFSVYCIHVFTHTAYLMGKHEIATQLHGFLQTAREQGHFNITGLTPNEIETYVRGSEKSLGDRFAQIAEIGRKMSLDSAIALAKSLSAYVATHLS
jgi:predicted ATPase/DNA-binding SARP family transcriptional activator/Tfp pilus assembly protein PilF